LRLAKVFLGLICYSAVVALSFIVIIDAQKTFSVDIDEIYVVIQPDNTPMPTPLPAPPMAKPHPPIEEEPTPRFTTLAANEYYVNQGFDNTVFVAFGDFQLSFHIEYGLDIEYAMNTVYGIVELFDLINDKFPGWPFFDYFLVSGSGDIQNRHINYDFFEDPINGTITSMFFTQMLRHPLPWWISIGLEAYLLESSSVNLLSSDDLKQVLTSTNVPFGDAWFVPSLVPQGLSSNINDIAYTLISTWSQDQVLYDYVRLAQSDTHSFAIKLNDYISTITEAEVHTPLQFKYQFGDFKVITMYAGYVFVDDEYSWTWARVYDFVQYMEEAIGFVRTYFNITNMDQIHVTLYPFGVINIPASIVDLAYILGWDAPDVNFVTNDEIILASTSRLGTWAIAHEVTHLMLFREFPANRPATWMVEGMAVLGEILFRDHFEGERNYRFNVPTTGNINTLARDGSGHRLPIEYDEYDFGRDGWTYDEVGSFVFYLYNRFGMEPLLEMYQSSNDNQFEIALDIFDEELMDLINSWRASLWPNGEPRGWW